MSKTADYLNYLDQVVGVKSVVLTTEQTIKIPLLVVVENYKRLTPEEDDLLKKMLSALNLNSAHLLVCDLSERASYQPQFILTLSSQNQGAQTGFKNEVSTYSPSQLIKQPELKKTAWAEMQKLMRLLGVNP